MQVETEIDESPFNTLTSVLFLLQNEHVVVEELLQFLVDEVNPQLLEGVVLNLWVYKHRKILNYVEDFETGDIQHTNEVVTVESFLIQSDVAFFDDPVEDTSVDALGHGTDCPVDLVDVLTLGHPLGTDLNF